jgi:heme exporter protein C
MFEKFARASWWKILTVILLFYTVIYGFLVQIPELNILEESIRNLFFHVPMWFSMMTLMSINLYFSIAYLSKGEKRADVIAESAAKVGFFMGVLGILTGAVWARVTWGAWWVFAEVKLNGAAAAILVYAAYFILRNSFSDEELKARFSAVYAIFAFVMFMVLINVIPRMSSSSLHPGNGGNPGFNAYDLDSNLRTVFYPAVLAWIGLGLWLTGLQVRLELIFRKKHQLD